jgi:hypothetical protein
VIGHRGATLDELEALYRRLFDVFVRVAANVTADPERARDAVQEAFATAVRKRGSFRREGPLEAWVWRIVLNAARSDARRGIPTVGYDEATASNGRPERDAELRVALARCRSGSGSPSFSVTTRTSTTPRSARRSGFAPARSPRRSMQRTRPFATSWRRSEHD